MLFVMVSVVMLMFLLMLGDDLWVVYVSGIVDDGKGVLMLFEVCV